MACGLILRTTPFKSENLDFSRKAVADAVSKTSLVYNLFSRFQYGADILFARRQGFKDFVDSFVSEEILMRPTSISGYHR